MPATFEIEAEELRGSWLAQRFYGQKVTEKAETEQSLKFISIGNVASIASGTYVREYSHHGIPYIRGNNVRPLVFNLTPEDVAYVPVEGTEDISNRCRTEQGDVLVPRTGTVDKAAVVPKALEGAILSQHVTRLSVTEPKALSPILLCWFLNTDLGREQLNSVASGTTRLELTHKALRTVKAPLFDPATAAKISVQTEQALSSYYRATGDLRELIEAADNLVFQEVSPDEGYLPVDSASANVFEVDAGQLHTLWTPASYEPSTHHAVSFLENQCDGARLGEIALVSRGKGTTTDQYSESGTVPFLRTSDLINGSIDPFPQHKADRETYDEFGQSIQDGDILYSIEGKIGQVALLFSQHPVVFKNHIERVRLIESLRDTWSFEESCGWLYLMLAGRAGQLQAKRHSVVQSTISGLASRLRRFIIPVPRAQNQDKARSLARESYSANQQSIQSAAQLSNMRQSILGLLGTK